MPRNTIIQQVSSVGDYKKQQRVGRHPQHTFNLKRRPYEIVPFLIAPVLPGETLDGGFLQATTVTDKIADRLIPWVDEFHIFYIPLRALTQSDDGALTEEQLNSLFLDPTFDLRTGMGAAANSVPYYDFKAGVPWGELLYDYIVARWFRDEGEAVTPTWDDYHIAQVDQGNIFHSLKEESALADDTELPGVDEQEELDILPGFTTHYAQWELMRDQGMTELTYRDYLKSYGITPPKDIVVDAEDVTPSLEAEKIISVRKWTNPTLAPQQGDSASTAICYWRHGTRLTKRMMFAEPGFIFGVKTTRAKIYRGNQKGSAAGLLSTAFTWLPAVLNHLGYTSILEQLDSATDGILQGGDEDYWFDIKDLFLHGDQFVNHALGGGRMPAIPVVSNLDKKYLTETMMNAMFADTGGTASYIYDDGSLHMDILGRIRDTSPKV